MAYWNETTTTTIFIVIVVFVMGIIMIIIVYYCYYSDSGSPCLVSFAIFIGRINRQTTFSLNDENISISATPLSSRLETSHGHVLSRGRSQKVFPAQPPHHRGTGGSGVLTTYPPATPATPVSRSNRPCFTVLEKMDEGYFDSFNFIDEFTCLNQ